VIPRTTAAAAVPGAAMRAALALHCCPRPGWHLWLMTAPLQHSTSCRWRIVMSLITCGSSRESVQEKTLAAGFKSGIYLPAVPLPLHALQDGGLIRASRELEPLSVALPTLVRIEVEGPAGIRAT